MLLSLLHISDLHRDPDNPLSNESLLDSLERDHEHYRSEIKDPELIIVSGDLIQGIAPDATDPINKLSAQYAEAEDFLVQLADRFVNGDRQRVIIVPGNHDVSYYHAMSSMRPLLIDPSDAKAKHLVRQIFGEHSKVRWSWNELRFYEIINGDTYLERLAPFAAFYEGFYQKMRTYDLQPERQYDVFDYPQYGLCAVGFNSCYNNDPLNRQGSIHPDSLSEVARRLRQTHPDKLLLAVWHHNTGGSPMQSDYLEPQIVELLIDDGFSIGFHGHQHKAQFIDQRFTFGGDRKITIVSAGSLCAGSAALPSGHSRAYNIIEVNTETLKARLHVRQVVNPLPLQPIWGPGLLPATSKSFIDFDVQPPLKRVSSDSAILGRAEELVRERNFKEAIPLLRTITQNPLGRRMILECFVETDDHEAIVEQFSTPKSKQELIYLVDALWEEKKLDKLRELMDSDFVSNNSDPAIREVRPKYEERLGT